MKNMISRCQQITRVFVSACQAFDKVGVRGFTADYSYDYTCMETLQGLSISELSSVEGRKWRTVYSDSENTKREGLDDTVWPEAFERMEQFIQDTGLSQEDLNMNYDDVVEMYKVQACHVLWQFFRCKNVPGSGH